MAMVFPTSPTVGQVFTSAGRSWVWNGSAWDAPSATNVLTVPVGLELIKTQTIGTAVSSVTVTDAFNSKYDNYKILVSGGAGSAATNYLTLRLDSVATGYQSSIVYTSYAGSVLGSAGHSNATSFLYTGESNTTTIGADINLTNVSTPKQTKIFCQFSDAANAGVFTGFCSSTAAHTSFTFTCSSGTITGGTIRVYGYRNTL
jgi:hypothetical protein